MTWTSHGRGKGRARGLASGTEENGRGFSELPKQKIEDEGKSIGNEGKSIGKGPNEHRKGVERA